MAVKKISMNKIRDKYKTLPIDRKWVILGLFLAIISFFVDVRPIIFLTLFSIANAILLSIDRYINAPLDLEFSTFSAVLMTIEYGLKWGIAVAVITKLAAIFYNRNIRVDHFFMILGYVLAALFAGLFKNIFPVLLLGIIVTVLVNLYVVFISKFVTMLSDYEIVMYGTSNLLFNVVLFIGFAEMLLYLM